jgi:flavorubredoxin
MILAFFALVGTLFSQTVLIASENTSYKKKLVQALTEELKEEGFAVETVNLQNGELEGVDPSAFAAVVISNSGVNKRVRPQVTAWLESIVGNDDNVIVHTTKRDEWDEALKVDAISSASRTSNINDVVKEIMTLIKTKL